jgi:hypothetical protein
MARPKPSTPIGHRPILTAWAALAVAIAAFVVFLPALHGPFLYDDHANFVTNSKFRGLGFEQIKWMFTTFLMGHYQPLSWLTLGINYQMFGMEPTGYRATNMLMHSVSAVLVFCIALLLWRHWVFAERRPSDRLMILFAAGAALLFAVHPLRVESVVWITERRDVQSSCLLLGAIACYLMAVRPGVSDRSRRWRVASLVFYLLSLLSRAMGVTLPLLLLVLDWYPLRRLRGGPRRWFEPSHRGVLVEKLAYAVPAAIFAIIAPIAQREAGAVVDLERHDVVARLAQAAYGLAFYARKTLWPTGLSPLCELRMPLDPTSAKYLGSAAAVCCVVCLALTIARKLPGLLVALILYAACLAPVLGLLQSGVQEVADRYSYLASIGLCVLAASAGLSVAVHLRRIATASTCLIVTVFSLGVLTLRQSQLWSDPFLLWTQAATVDPRCASCVYDMGYALELRGDDIGALREYMRAVEIKPTHCKALNNIGSTLRRLGREDEALPYFEAALRCNPDLAVAHYNISASMALLGRFDQAIYHLNEVLKQDPDDQEARQHLAEVMAWREQARSRSSR